MDYASASVRLLDVALWLGLASLAATVGLVAAMPLCRWRWRRRQAREQALAARWRPRLRAAAGGGALPAAADIAASERAAWVELWIAMHDGLESPAHKGLAQALVASGLDERCRRWLPGRRDSRRRLLAVVALARLAQPSDWSQLAPLLDDERAWIAVAAGRGLLRIDPGRAAPELLARLSQRPDWPRASLLAAVREAGASAVTAPLLAWLATAPSEQLPHGLPLLVAGEPEAVQQALLGLLEPERPADVLAAAIKQLQSRRALPALRVLCAHPAWEVRTQAAAALGRLRDPDDGERLRAMLGDRFWWVRYRAAHALLDLPGMDADALSRQLESMDDRYARDILRQAGHERALLQAVAQ